MGQPQFQSIEAAIGAALITIQEKKIKIRAVPTTPYVKKSKVGIGGSNPSRPHEVLNIQKAYNAAGFVHHRQFIDAK